MSRSRAAAARISWLVVVVVVVGVGVLRTNQVSAASRPPISPVINPSTYNSLSRFLGRAANRGAEIGRTVALPAPKDQPSPPPCSEFHPSASVSASLQPRPLLFTKSLLSGLDPSAVRPEAPDPYLQQFDQHAVVDLCTSSTDIPRSHLLLLSFLPGDGVTFVTKHSIRPDERLLSDDGRSPATRRQHCRGGECSPHGAGEAPVSACNRRSPFLFPVFVASIMFLLHCRPTMMTASQPAQSVRQLPT